MMGFGTPHSDSSNLTEQIEIVTISHWGGHYLKLW